MIIVINDVRVYYHPAFSLSIGIGAISLEMRSDAWCAKIIEIMLNLDSEKHLYMFAGKGGVGKTTCAAVTALHLASSGKRTLIISTDPSPSVRDIFEVTSRENRVKVADNLFLEEIREDDVKARWKKKFGPEVYEVISAYIPVEKDFIDYFAEAPGISDEFMLDYIRELVLNRDFDHIVWDTAPSGHTLRLLKMPGIFISHMNAAVKVYSRLKKGHESGRSIFTILSSWKKMSQDLVDFLRANTQYTLVAIPEALSVLQVEGILKDLKGEGLVVGQIIVNNVLKSYEGEFLKARHDMQQRYIQQLTDTYGKTVGITELCLLPGEARGIASLRKLDKALFGD